MNCYKNAMVRYMGGETLSHMSYAMIVVLTVPNTNHPGSKDDFFQGIHSLHCSLLVAHVNLTRLPLVALTVGKVPIETAQKIITLPGVILLNAASILEWRTLRCLGVSYNIVSERITSNATSSINAASHIRSSAFQKLLVWSLHQWISRALVLDVDTIVNPHAWKSLQTLVFGVNDSIPDFLTLRKVDFAAGPGVPFNSGVMLMKPSNHTMRDLATLVVKGGYDNVSSGKTGGDQDLLNAYFRSGFKNWKKLSPNDLQPQAKRYSACLLPFEYNVRLMHRRHERPPNAVIIHFMGYPKPWSFLDSGHTFEHNLLHHKSSNNYSRNSYHWGFNLFRMIHYQCKILLNTTSTSNTDRRNKAAVKKSNISIPKKSHQYEWITNRKKYDDCIVAASTSTYENILFSANELHELNALIQLMPSGQQTFADRRCVRANLTHLHNFCI